MSELPTQILTVRSTAIIDEAIETVATTRTALGFTIPELGEPYSDRSYRINAISERLRADNIGVAWTGAAAIIYILKYQILTNLSLDIALNNKLVKDYVDQQALAVLTARTRMDIIIRHLYAEKEVATTLNDSGCIAASISLQNSAALVGISASNNAIGDLQATTEANTAKMDKLRLRVEENHVDLMNGSIPQVPQRGGKGLLLINPASLRLSSQRLTERSLEFAEEHRVAMVESIPAKVARTHGQVFTETFDSALAAFERNQNILLLRIKVQLAELAERLNSAANALERIDIDAAGALL